MELKPDHNNVLYFIQDEELHEVYATIRTNHSRFLMDVPGLPDKVYMTAEEKENLTKIINTMDNQTKKTELTKLIEEYPELNYQDQFFYPSPDCDDYITVKDSKSEPVNADQIIQDHYYWQEKLAGTGVDAETYIKANFKDYEEALNYAKP